MSTKRFFLTALTVAMLTAASFSIILASDQEDGTLLKYYDDRMYLLPDSSGDTTDGGINIPPTGH